MNIVAIIVVGLLVIGGVVYVAGMVLSAVATSAAEIRKDLVDWLGRKHRGCRAFVPPELAPDSTPLPKHDPDRAALLAFAPKVETPPHVSPVFKSQMDVMLRDWPAPTNQINIDRVCTILSMPNEPGYLPFIRLARKGQSNPVQPLFMPSSIAAPSWTPWNPNFKEPSLDLPFYSGRLSLLNRFVTAAYQDEITKLATARQRKESLLAECQKRNQEVEKLAEAARGIWEKASAVQEKILLSAIQERERQAKAFDDAVRTERERCREVEEQLSRRGEEGLLTRIHLAVNTASLPPFVPREGTSRFDPESGILIHEHRFPNLADIDWVKYVQLKTNRVLKPANQKEKKDAAAMVYPSLCIRLAAEILRLDDEGIVKAIAVNGWARYTEKSTGQEKEAYCASLFATKEQLAAINLSAVDPIAAFDSLKGVAARSLELTPIAPILRLDMNDPRFVDPKEVLSRMLEGENLAAMDWEDFEHLCRELFERAFASSGAEVKVTQASRDQGVDAVVFDPDPLRGGKIIIQAKRYTNTVDVSAVRDLYGAVINEGAVKGILVTTSQFGSESYAFAKDKPLTLLNGRELLGLLERHGYKFRIDLAEARSKAS